jgi:hypothetical protein
MLSRCAVWGCVALVTFTGASSAAPKSDIGKRSTGAIEIVAKPVPSFNRFGAATTHFGKLEYLGGVELSAPDVNYFGGWSGLALDPDGKNFVAVSDRGVWLSGVLQHDAGTISGVANARVGPLLSLEGKPLTRIRDRDAEAVAIADGTTRAGSFVVAFEQNSRLVRYDMGPDGLSAARAILEKPTAARSMRANQGFEAMTVMKGGPYKGMPVAISERHFDKNRNHTGWVWGGRGPEVFHLSNLGEFDVTDIASLDDGTLFVLERRFRWLEGLKMRIRRIDRSDLKIGTTVEAETLIEANLEYQIDNMEALAVTRAADGSVVLTVMSDDNYNRFLQRTLILQFALKATSTAKARPQQ